MNILDKVFLSGVPEEFGSEVVFEIAGLPITSTVTTTWIIIVFLAIFSWLATRNLKREPKAGSLQNVAEAIVEGTRGLVKSAMGPGMQKFTPYVGALMIYLTISNLIGILPGQEAFKIFPPTADLNTTFALGAITFVNIHYFGIKSQGIGEYLKGYFEPLPFIMPLNVIGNLADPISLSFRLFGNMIGAVVIMSMLSGVVATVIPGLFSLYFDVFVGILQAFIFTMLTMTYITIEME